MQGVGGECGLSFPAPAETDLLVKPLPRWSVVTPCGGQEPCTAWDVNPLVERLHEALGCIPSPTEADQGGTFYRGSGVQ